MRSQGLTLPVDWSHQKAGADHKRDSAMGNTRDRFCTTEQASMVATVKPSLAADVEVQEEQWIL